MNVQSKTSKHMLDDTINKLYCQKYLNPNRFITYHHYHPSVKNNKVDKFSMQQFSNTNRLTWEEWSDFFCNSNTGWKTQLHREFKEVQVLL